MMRVRPTAPEERFEGPRADALDEEELTVALALLPGRMRRATRLFHDLTGFFAVTSILGVTDGVPASVDISPPVHPRCAERLRTVERESPCEAEWRRHVRRGLRSPAVQSHVCALGLRCSCVPIIYGGTLIGIAKFVVGPDVAARRMALATRILALAVSHECQDAFVGVLSERVRGLEKKVGDFQCIHNPDRAEGESVDPASVTSAPSATTGAQVDRVVDYIHGHYLDPHLSLGSVGRALGLSDKYVTHVFTRVAGQRMHAYIVQLRLQRACTRLLTTGDSIKRIAYESGFRQPDRFRRAFRQQVGVAPSTYRRIFTRA